jgi:Xaa-Pro aminopeptidase
MRRWSLIASLLPLLLAGSLPAQEPQLHTLPTLREQAAEEHEWVRARLDRVLPDLMREHGVEMWILSMREYAEDPVFRSIVAPTTFAARRRSIYLFHDRGPAEGVERLALGGGDQGGLYRPVAPPEPGVEGAELWGDGQWRLLRRLVEERDPRTIALNIDEVHAFADGLHAGEREALERTLGPYVERVVREPRLAIDYLSIRLPEMLPRYRRITETVHAILAEAFSERVVTPGTTTTDDIRWWLRERARELGYDVWFHPSVSLARADGAGWRSGTIERGDVLWTDFGVVAMNLHTDTQHMGYVLRPGETDAPAGLRRCLAVSNRLQDLLLAEMVPGRTGNEILHAALASMRAAGIDGTIYTHPIGDHGHGAGPLIGRWDHQGSIPGRGDLVLRPMTWHSIELQATVPVPEWDGQPLSCRQEEEVHLDAAGDPHWVFRRQERFHLVRAH